MAEEFDPRPEVSLFDTPSIEVKFCDEGRLFIPSSLFLDGQELRLAGIWPRPSMVLDDITVDVGHVLFYFLLTGKYQCVRPKGSSPQEKLVNELTTSIAVHNMSRKYELPSLQDAAKGEIKRLVKAVPFPVVLNLLRNLHLSPSATEAWLDEYVQGGLQSLFQTPKAFLENTSPQVDKDAISFSNIILKSLAHLIANGVVPDRENGIARSASPPELNTIEEEPATTHEEVPEASPVEPEGLEPELPETVSEHVPETVSDQEPETETLEPETKPESDDVSPADQKSVTEPQAAEEPKAELTNGHTETAAVAEPVHSPPRAEYAEPEAAPAPAPEVESAPAVEPVAAAVPEPEPASKNEPACEGATEAPVPVKMMSKKKKRRSFFGQLIDDNAATSESKYSSDGESSIHQQDQSGAPNFDRVPTDRPSSPSPSMLSIRRIRYLGR